MIHLTYTLREHGWANLCVALDTGNWEFRISYMSDALNDFVSSVVAVLTGDDVIRFALIDEPGEHCWTLYRSADDLRVTVVQLDRMYRTQCYGRRPLPGQRSPEEEGTLVLSFECAVQEFAGAVARMVSEMKCRYTPADFMRTRNPELPPSMAARLDELIER